MKNNIHSYLIIITVLLLLSSCIGQKKATRLYHKIEDQKQAEMNTIGDLQDISAHNQNKLAEGTIDDSSSTAINNLLNVVHDSSVKRIDNYKTIEKRLKKYRRVSVREFNRTTPLLDDDLTRINEEKENLRFVNTLLNKNTFFKFNSAVFFGPGEYTIPDEKIPMAITVFTPVIDSLIDLVKRFPQKKLISTVISCGYADAQGINRNGELYNQLCKNIGKNNPDNDELNAELSRLRADNITAVLKTIFAEKQAGNWAIAGLRIKFYKIGKGQEHPNKKIIDYQIDDERRRIVVIYWNALPE
jgi:hypothetical protein